MYAPHASPAQFRPAALEPLSSTSHDHLSVGTGISAVGLAGALAALCVAYHLLRTHALLLWSVLGAVPGRRYGQSGGARATADPRRSASPAWFGIAIAITGFAAFVPVAGAWLGAHPATLSAAVSVVALVAGAAFHTALLLMLPVAGAAARLRWAVDGAIVCLCLLFCAWAVALHHTSIDPALLAIITFQCWVISTAVLAGTGAAGARRGSILCAAGACLATLALSALTVALAQGLPAMWLVIIGAFFVAAPVLVWRGIATLGSPRPPSAPLVPFPRLLAIAIGVAMVLFAALHELLEGERIDGGALAIGAAALLGVGVRMLVWPPPAQATSSPVPAVTPATTTPPVADPRTAFDTRAELCLAIARLRCESRTSGSLITVGIDGLESLPPAVADHLLREAARRLHEAGEPSDAMPGDQQVYARLSPSRFAVLTRAGAVRAYGLASRLLTAIEQPLVLPDRTVRLSVGVGLAQLAGAASTEETLRHAELALVRSHQLGSGAVELYEPGLEEAIARHETIQGELPDALRRGELDLIYQPIMDLERNRPTAVEALLRWRHPRLGTLMPADVIPMAEQSGAIGEIGDWVLRRAAAQLATWRREGRDLSMAVNLSPRGLEPVRLATELGQILTAHDLPADRLVFEVKESAVDKGEIRTEHFAALRSLGVRTALDEFGSGPESLRHLRQLPIDMIKIDRSFFDGTALGPSRAAGRLPLMDVIVGVGRRLGVDVVAHGLEAPDHLAVVRTAGCRLGQGHLFARPQPAERTEAYLAGFPTRS